MNNKILLFFFITILLFSCNKPDEPENGNTDTNNTSEYDKVFDDYVIFDNNSTRIYVDTIKNIFDTVVFYDTHKEYNDNNELEKIYVYYNSSYYGSFKSYIIGKFYENDDVMEVLGKSIYFNNLNDTTLREYGQFVCSFDKYTINNVEFNNVKKFEYYNPYDDNATCYWAKNVGIIERIQYRTNDTLHWLITEYTNY